MEWWKRIALIVLAAVAWVLTLAINCGEALRDMLS